MAQPGMLTSPRPGLGSGHAACRRRMSGSTCSDGARISQCPYKGDGQHWNLTVGENTVQDAAWTLLDPLGEADVLVGFFCFYPTKVEVEVDGERLVE